MPIPLSIPRIEGNAWRYIKDCLDTGWVSSVGAYVKRFEKKAAAYAGARHAVAGINGTSSLHMALSLCGVGKGDGVIVPALTFIATANAVTYCGAVCVLLDCEPRRFNIDLDLLEDFLSRRCRRRGGRLYTREGIPLKAVLATHILGYPIDMPRLLKLARAAGLEVVEDAAEAIGSFWGGRHCGSFGRAGILSFNGNKIITSGGGGMLLTSEAALARRARHLTQQAKRPGPEYLHDAVGYNYRMSNVTAALGLSQLELLPRFLKKRAEIAGWYRERLPGVPLEPGPAAASWNRWLLAVELPSLAEKERLLRALSAAGAEARSLWIPVPRQKPYRLHPRTPCPRADRAYETALNVPSSSGLSESQVDRVCRVLRRAPLLRLLA